MEITARLGLSLILVGSLTVAALMFDENAPGKLALDVWNVPANLLQERTEKQRDERLAHESEEMHERFERKRRIAAAVAGGRLTLAEAADQFFLASNNAPYFWDTYGAKHPDWSPRKRCAHLVIDDVRLLLVDQKQDPSALVDELRAQVAAWEAR